MALTASMNSPIFRHGGRRSVEERWEESALDRRRSGEGGRKHLNTPGRNTDNPGVNTTQELELQPAPAESAAPRRTPAAAQPTAAQPTVLDRLKSRSWALISRDLLLGLGFLVIVAGSLANVALFFDSREADTQPVVGAGGRDADRDVADDASGVSAGAGSASTTGLTLDPVLSDPVLPPLAPIDPFAETYTVVAGDVLYEIALRHGTTPLVLIELNGLVDPNLIEVGQVLLLPEPAFDPQPASEPASDTQPGS